MTAVVCVLLAPIRAAAQSTQELKRMALADLLKIEVTTVSRTPERISTVPAAVFVITQEDIHRSGATTLAEALRLAPGVEVARISAGTWAVGIRGFADRLARSMLVLIDGRAVYSPLFAGTYWETQDTLFTDIDRIEVIRGPGGTLWGANAVNGIINIVTKSAKDTTGAVVAGGAGTQDRAFASVRYGATAGSVSYRVYAKAFDHVSQFHADGNDWDAWRAGRAGMRADWSLAQNRTFTLQSDLYDGRLGERPTVALYTPPFSQTVNMDAPLSGGNVLARYGGRAGDRADFQLQAYYDRTNRDEIPVTETRDTFDVDFQSTWRGWRRNTVVWGAGGRVTSGRITAVSPTSFTPNSRTDGLFTAFVQDDVALPAGWRLTLGSKFEHNNYSGFEVQPTVRALWVPDAMQTVWGAVTRAVRTPSRVETDYSTTSLVSPATPSFVRLIPDPGFESEKLRAYEAGYRVHPAPQMFFTASAFYNDHEDLLSTEAFQAFVETTAPPPPRLIIPVDFANGIQGNSYGIELTGDVRPRPWWRLTSNYSYIDVAVHKIPGSRDVSQERRYEGFAPHHQFVAGSSFDIRGSWAVDAFVRHLSALPAGPVPAYTTADVRTGWRPAPSIELSVVGQNLLQAHHLEWPSGSGTNVEIRRSVYARVTWLR